MPNSDADFGANVTEGKVLASKRENAAYYSENMAKAGSTVAIDANFDAIQNHVNGMSIAGTEALAAEESPVDAISGATLVDTAGYLATILAAAQAINSCAAALCCAPGKTGKKARPGGRRFRAGL